MNVGDEVSSGPITVTDRLPAGIAPGEIKSGFAQIPEFLEWSCEQLEDAEGVWTVTCVFTGPVAAGGYAPFLDIGVSAPDPSMSGSLKNEVSVSGGGAVASRTIANETPIGSVGPFEVGAFDFEARSVDGEPLRNAGAHPWEVTTTFEMPTIIAPPGTESTVFQAVRNLKNVSVELPLGFVGNPQAAARCTETELRFDKCPVGSRVGTFAALAGNSSTGAFFFTSDITAAEGGCCSAVYNMVPENGYPAEFGFTFLHVPIMLYASVVHGDAGYRLRVATSGIPATLETYYASVTFFGNPGKLNGSDESAFLTNPTDCLAGPLSSRIEATAWEDPEHPAVREATAYSSLVGCNLLQFSPSLAIGPSVDPGGQGTTQADEPSAYDVDLKVPQSDSFEELATPSLKDATVTLPAGVSVSPSAADGLAGCQVSGPEGINIGSSDLGNKGQDLGDPEATELGAGHAGGNGSLYDDGFYHTARGHCPGASTLGTVEVFTPLLPTRCGGEGQPACQPGESPAPLQGHIYLAQPKCGGQGQPACTEASATNGELYGGYIEVEGSGVIVKIPGSIAADPQTGQLTGTFKENPQFPFSEFKLHFHGGPRAPVANPQSCGAFTPTSILSSWASPQLPAATPISPSFGVDWDGSGGACPATLPFAPSFSAGTTVPTAGGFSPFVLTFSRQDREQNLSGLTETMPPGLLGKIAGIPLCGEAQANTGTCGPESQLGSTNVTAGPGSSPLSVTGGRVYLTTGYKGAPFGLSIVVPAVAGPFNLGDVVVRAAIHIDPNTSQVTVVSDPLPQLKDGVPFRLRTIHVTIDRPGFTLNPTNCAQQQITATITGAQGASASVASPFAVAGCAGLPFKPSFSISTQGKTSKANGASLTVKVAQKPGEANIRKVQLQLPKILPARLTTLQKACTEAQFNTNPAGCPAASVIGTAKAVTPILNAPLTGPAYLVSHGGAAFPDVEFVLQGEGVQITLDGKTDIKKGITYSRFETVPDAPISSFETVLPQGPHSALAANGSLCATTRTVSVRKRTTVRVHGRVKHVTRTLKRTVSQSLVVPTTIVGQNGARVVQSTKVAVIGCAKAKPAKKTKAKVKKKHKGKGRRGAKKSKQASPQIATYRAERAGDSGPASPAKRVFLAGRNSRSRDAVDV